MKSILIGILSISTALSIWCFLSSLLQLSLKLINININSEYSMAIIFLTALFTFGTYVLGDIINELNKY